MTELKFQTQHFFLFRLNLTYSSQIRIVIQMQNREKYFILMFSEKRIYKQINLVLLICNNFYFSDKFKYYNK